MKTQSFTKCLAESNTILQGQENSILFLSIGSHVKKNASIEKIHTQQAPLFMLHSDKPVVIIVIDPLFVHQDPVYFDHLETYMVQKNGTQIVDPRSPNVVWMKCTDFAQDRSSALLTLVRMIQHNPMIQFYLGDFTITNPYQPFYEYPWLLRKVQCLPNVWLSQSCTREIFMNARDMCGP